RSPGRPVSPKVFPSMVRARRSGAPRGPVGLPRSRAGGRMVLCFPGGFSSAWACAFAPAPPTTGPSVGRCLTLRCSGPPAVPPRDVVQHPDLARYVRHWGQEQDLGAVALHPTQGKPIGAAWLRLWDGAERGYGFLDAQTPELSMAVRPAYRGQGVGTRLLAH